MDEREKVLKQLREVEEFMAGERRKFRLERSILVFLAIYTIIMAVTAILVANS